MLPEASARRQPRSAQAERQACQFYNADFRGHLRRQQVIQMEDVARIRRWYTALYQRQRGKTCPVSEGPCFSEHTRAAERSGASAFDPRPRRRAGINPVRWPKTILHSGCPRKDRSAEHVAEA